MQAARHHAPIRQLRGAGRLAIAATHGLTELVEALHRGVTRAPAGSGITGLVYRSVRGITHLVGGGIDIALQGLEPWLTAPEPDSPAVPGTEALLAILNGVLGDYLAATDNPLAIPMQLRRQGRALTAAPQDAGPRPLLLIHGLCMNDLQWQRGNLAEGLEALGYTPLHLHYNSGLHISDNGRQLARLLERLLQQWPVPLQDLSLLGHSMGGLLARSAVHHAQAEGLQWPRRLRHLVSLGSPHLGAPLEQGGQQLQLLLGLSAYARPLIALTRRRSAGIQDLRWASLREQDWGQRRSLPLPAGVDCYAIAATTAGNPAGLPARLLGDGLVPVASALGRHREAARRLDFPPDHQWVLAGAGHLALQTHPAVLTKLREWLG
ncbi:alpha/beta hydrolase [Roseateles sp. DAIF2]|uniref:alpha/beta hydrolase n=1 Tax=Roseateles sp. DAIF2 TaxID=2714952 RepID=UPI0018A2FD2A|nr:alpha/beta hydrolase [Roseateles sp. DAIF2]QPF75589.1 alpha/beta hydrolase [Roseateles sp. DAIF2]